MQYYYIMLFTIGTEINKLVIGLALALTLVGAVGVIAIQQSVDAQEGIPFQKNFGQCKKEKNDNACRNAKDRGAFKPNN